MGVRMAEGFYVTYDAWILPKRWAWFVNLCTRVRCDLPPEMYVTCEIFPLWKNIKISLTPCTQEDRFEVFLSHIWSPNFQDPHPPLLYSEVTLKVLVFVSFFKDIDTKQLEGKCTFDAMYEKLLNMHLGNIHFKTYFSIVACGSKESGIQNFLGFRCQFKNM